MVVVLQFGGFVEELAGEAEEVVDGRSGLAGEITEGVVDAVIGQRGGLIYPVPLLARKQCELGKDAQAKR